MKIAMPCSPSSCNITLRSGVPPIPSLIYRVCRTDSWMDKLLPYVRLEVVGSQFTSASKRTEAIEAVVLSWLLRYKYKILTVCVTEKVCISTNTNDLALVPAATNPPKFRILLDLIVNDLARVLDNIRIEQDEYKIMREYTGSSILVLHTPKPPSYLVVRNRGYYLMKQYIEENTSPGSDRWSRRVVICELIRQLRLSIHYEGVAREISLSTAVNLLERVLRIDSQRNRESKPILLMPTETVVGFSKVDSMAKVKIVDTMMAKVAKVESTIRKVTTPKSTKIEMWTRTHCRTRSTYVMISQLISSGSRSKNRIQYTSDTTRHFLGQPPKLKRLPGLMFPGNRATIALGRHGLTADIIQRRIDLFRELEGVHSALIHLSILSPRDQWEDWIDNFMEESGCDRAFMCLIVIIMSSSTSDNQLAHIIPRLFSSGLVSARTVIEVAKQYGMDTLCSLLSAGGRYYQNAERILNAADYFVQFHNGTIPESISVPELCTLHGVGYKTANIVVTTAFRRIEGIPSDIHVIRWSSMLGWCPTVAVGLKCSKMLESWLPRSEWESINPVFGSFGQLLVSDKRDDILSIALQHPSFEIRNLFLKASKLYNREKK